MRKETLTIEVLAWTLDEAIETTKEKLGLEYPGQVSRFQLKFEAVSGTSGSVVPHKNEYVFTAIKL